MSLHDAISLYHDLLTDDLAAESQAQLDAMQQRHGLAFGNRPLCTVLRPRFLTTKQFRLVRERVRVLMGAFRKLHQAALSDPEFLRQFRLTEAETQLLECDPGFRCPMPTSRLDAFFVSPTRLQFTEYNAETPAGAGYSDVLGECFLTLPVMARFLRYHRLLPLPSRPGVGHALLTAFRQWRGTSEKPRIAILDWKEVPTYGEFVLFEKFFHNQGLECKIVDPREVEFRDGKLLAGDYPITLIYKRVLISELLERGGLEHPVVRAVRAGAVCLVNPFRCKPLYKKASLAALSDERNEELFDHAERSIIQRSVPWTRVVEERKTRHDPEGVVDLVPFLLHNRQRLVLKPNDDYGGKGIVLGWTVTASTWEKAVQTALETPYVAQERVRLPAEPYPSLVDGRVQVLDRLYDTAPFVCEGEYMDGCLTRIARDPLLNVTAGGGSTVATFLLEKR